MPANRLSFAVTDAYRERVNELRLTVEAQARIAWGRITEAQDEGGVDLDEGMERWLNATVPVVAAGQAEAVRASVGYLAAFLTSELGEPAEVDSPKGTYVGVSRDGRPLRDALGSPMIGVKVALSQGADLASALSAGRTRALRLVGLEVDHAARECLRDLQIADERVTGYRRAIRGTCGACLGAAAKTYAPEEPFLTHPGCQCYPEPTVKGVRERYPRETGDERFASMTEAEQNEAVGPEVAQLIRNGVVTLAALVAIQRQATTQDFISQASVTELDVPRRRARDKKEGRDARS